MRFLKYTLAFLLLTSAAWGATGDPVIEGRTADRVSADDMTIENDATNPTDAVNLRTLLDNVGISLNFWISNQTLTHALIDSEAALQETPSSDPETLSTITFKSSVVDTPTPFIIKEGSLIEVHFDANVTSLSSVKLTSLTVQLFYMDADGSGNQVQIGSDSDSTGNLTASQAHHELHIHVAADTMVPAGKRLWLKVIADSASSPPAYPEINFYYDDPDHHIIFGVAGSVLGNFVQLASFRTLPFIGPSLLYSIATNGATYGTSERATNDINLTYFAFDNTTEEFTAFELVPPEDWNLSTLKAKFQWTSATGSTAGDTVEWEFQCGAQSDGDAIDAALGTGQVVTDTLLADNGADRQWTSATPALTVGGTPALGDVVHCKVSRNVSGTDNLVEDAWLTGLLIQYQGSSTPPSEW